MRIFTALLFSSLLTVSASAQPGTGSPQSISNAQAIEVISEDWNRLVGWLLIGERTVGNVPPADCKTEQMAVAQYDFILNAERAGLVTIRYWDDKGAFLKEKDYTNEERIDFFLSGRLEKMTIIPTKEAQQEQVKLDITGRTGCMSFKVGDYRIEAVTENRAIRKGAVDLAAVNVIYRVDYRPIYQKIYTAGKVKISNMRKANVLLRYDPPRKRWFVFAFDAANADEEIKPVNIPAAYERIE